MNCFIASGHRTGSTHIGHTLCRLENLKMNSAMISTSKGFGADEHYVNPLMAQILFLLDGFVFHQHVKGTTICLDLLHRYGFKPIISQGTHG